MEEWEALVSWERKVRVLEGDRGEGACLGVGVPVFRGPTLDGSEVSGVIFGMSKEVEVS